MKSEPSSVPPPLAPAAQAAVIVYLAALSALNIAFCFVNLGTFSHLVAGEVIAVLQAVVLVMFLMHALRSPPRTKVVVAIAIFWVVVVLMGLTFSDYFTRGMLPNLLGH